MFYQDIFNAEGDGSQDDGTLFSLSGEFLEAARVLQASPPVRLGYSSATYYLLGHSAELMLKAYLFKHGQTIKDLRKINHNLSALSSLAREAGLSSSVSLEHLLKLASEYKEKSFEYRTRRKKTFPTISLLIEEIEMLQAAVFDELWE